jgi:hypothetical protein
MHVRVFEIPDNLLTEFIFDGGQDAVFKLVDWFRADDGPHYVQQWRTDAEFETVYTRYVQSRRYYNPNKAYLVMTQGPCFTIGYKAP